jgi:hypothetical protein
MKHTNRERGWHDPPPKSADELYDEYKKRNGKNANK